MPRVSILGCTGSIGRQTVEVCERFPDRFRVAALVTHQNVELAFEQAERLHPEVVVIVDEKQAEGVPGQVHGAKVLKGRDAMLAAASGDAADTDIVLNAIVGVAGLEATMGALAAGKRLALANKESLVVGGELVTALVGTRGSELIPVDSEHGTIFACLVGERREDAVKIILTASGGPFRGLGRHELGSVTTGEALKHPRWTMGPKITVDSATLMNKGLEVIEARHLFSMDYDAIQVVIHPQSIVHSMVEFADGSIKAQLGRPDMRIPIQYALSYPERLAGPLPSLDLLEAGPLTFEEPDTRTFRGLTLAYEAGRAGGTAPAVLNGANEAAVAAFLDGRCSFLDIADAVGAALDAHSNQPADSLDVLLAADAWARTYVGRTHGKAE
jgi:1-deoxy-D-xylulose-5-phosphate reductoisomerase